MISKGEGPPVIRFHDLAQALAAFRVARETGRPCLLTTPPGGVAYAGAPFYQAVAARARREVAGAPATFVLDCGGDAAVAVEALRAGWRDLVLDSSSPARENVAAIAEAAGARLHDRAPVPLDLDRLADPEAACRDILSRETSEPLNYDGACGT